MGIDVEYYATHDLPGGCSSLSCSKAGIDRAEPSLNHASVRIFSNEVMGDDGAVVLVGDRETLLGLTYKVHDTRARGSARKFAVGLQTDTNVETFRHNKERRT